MRTLSVVVTAVALAAVLSGCGPHRGIVDSAPSPSPSQPAATGSDSTTPSSGAAGTVPSSGAAGSVPSSRASSALPGLSITGPVPCLTSQQHFNTDADRSTPQVCLRVGGAFDVETMRPEKSQVTSVVSSDRNVLTCGTPRPTVCQAIQTGQSTVTATDGGGVWRVLVFVGR
jgi:hypothetical protein